MQQRGRLILATSVSCLTCVCFFHGNAVGEGGVYGNTFCCPRRRFVGIMPIFLCNGSPHAFIHSSLFVCGGTALHYACNYNRGDCAALLIEHGANLTKRSAELQFVALHLGELFCDVLASSVVLPPSESTWSNCCQPNKICRVADTTINKSQ